MKTYRCRTVKCYLFTPVIYFLNKLPIQQSIIQVPVFICLMACMWNGLYKGSPLPTRVVASIVLGMCSPLPPKNPCDSTAASTMNETMQATTAVLNAWNTLPSRSNHWAMAQEEQGILAQRSSSGNLQDALPPGPLSTQSVDALWLLHGTLSMRKTLICCFGDVMISPKLRRLHWPQAVLR